MLVEAEEGASYDAAYLASCSTEAAADLRWLWVGAATARARGEDAKARCEFLPPARDVRVDGAEKSDEDDDLNRVNRITRYPNPKFWIFPFRFNFG